MSVDMTEKFSMITRRVGPSGGQAVIPQSNCNAYAEVAVSYGHLAVKAYTQGDVLLAQQYVQEYLNGVTLYQACEEMYQASSPKLVLPQIP